MPVDLAAYNNRWYKPGHFMKRWLWYLFNILLFKTSLFPVYRFKVFILRLFGARIGRNVIIKPQVNIKYPWFFEVGNNVWIGECVWIDNLGKVTIGNNVCLSQGCLLLSGNHDYTSSSFDLIINEIVLEDGVWIGAKSIVCGGAKCRDHSVLTAGSITAGELSAMGIYRGNPAAWVKQREFKTNV